MGSVCWNKGPDNEPGNENANQNKTGRNAVVAESRLYLLQLLAASQRLYLWLGWCFPQCWSCCFASRAVGREDECPVSGLNGTNIDSARMSQYYRGV